jgi:hypothetical protein
VMLNTLITPLVTALIIVALTTTTHRRLRPEIATRFIAAAILMLLVAAIPTNLVIAVAYLAHVPIIGVGVRWCTQALGVHGAVSAWLGIPAVTLLIAGCWRVTRLIRLRRSLCCHGDQHVDLIESSQPFAVTLPGTAGNILVSTSLWDSLDDQERQVVLAHEQAHARHRHDRFLLIAGLASAALPPLHHLAQRLRFTVERWADEEAARHCGDRELVAITLGKVAMNPAPSLAGASITAGFASLGVAGRMAALLAPPRRHLARSRVFALWTSLGVAAAAAFVQLHHLERLVPAFCLS